MEKNTNNELTIVGAEARERLIELLQRIPDRNQKELGFLYDFAKAFAQKWGLIP